MSDLELSLQLPRTEVVSGESLALQAVLVNRSPQPVSVQTFPVVPLEFEFRDAAGQIRYRCSEQDYRDSLAAGLQLPPPPQPEYETLSPGEFIRFPQDPALYTLSVLTPGRYSLVARLALAGRHIQAAPIELRVVPLELSRLAVAFCAYQNVALALFDHRSHEHPATLYYRPTSSGPKLEDAVAFRLGTASTPLRDLAVSIHTAPDLQGRWIAWLENGLLKARRLWGRAVLARPDAVATGLDQPRLAQPGFHPADGAGLFFSSTASPAPSPSSASHASPTSLSRCCRRRPYMPRRLCAYWLAGTPSRNRPPCCWPGPSRPKTPSASSPVPGPWKENQPPLPHAKSFRAAATCWLSSLHASRGKPTIGDTR
ncbi:MAG: hypothetical protein ACP5U2_02670 [Bryobacteraceae bacterium]